MMRVAFKVLGDPVAQPRQRVRVAAAAGGRPFAQNFTPAKHPVNAFKANVIREAQAAIAIDDGSPPFGYSMPELITDPVRLVVTFVMKRPNLPKKLGTGRLWAPKKPDVDNSLKSLCDALNGVIWQDDKQVVTVVAKKVYAAAGEGPCVEVEVITL